MTGGFMHTADSFSATPGIICNGEIYNFRAIREHMDGKYIFFTHSDSETILHLYQEKGPECVRDLDGMFSFAIYNGDNFMLARDPVGIKPLYYGYKEGHFISARNWAP